MTASSLLRGWALAAVLLLLLLVIIGIGYRNHRHRPLTRYKLLTRADRIIRWLRILFVLGGLAAGGWMVTATNHYQGVLAAPSLWAGVSILGLTAVDFLVLGRQHPPDQEKDRAHIVGYLPWKLIALLVLVLGLLVFAIQWAWTKVATDRRTHVYSWVLDGVFGWDSAPFPGPFYTSPLFYCLPLVLVLGIGAIVLLLRRPAYLPTPKYAALDQGLRRRTIRDIMLICLGAITPVLAVMGLSAAWAFGTLGPGSPERTLVTVVAGFIGAVTLGISFWIFANLLFLPVVEEDQLLARKFRAPAKAEHEPEVEKTEGSHTQDGTQSFSLPPEEHEAVSETVAEGAAPEVGDGEDGATEPGEADESTVPESDGTTEPDTTSPDETTETESESETEPEPDAESESTESESAEPTEIESEPTDEPGEETESESSESTDEPEEPESLSEPAEVPSEDSGVEDAQIPQSHEEDSSGSSVEPAQEEPLEDQPEAQAAGEDSLEEADLKPLRWPQRLFAQLKQALAPEPAETGSEEGGEPEPPISEESSGDAQASAESPSQEVFTEPVQEGSLEDQPEAQTPDGDPAEEFTPSEEPSITTDLESTPADTGDSINTTDEHAAPEPPDIPDSESSDSDTPTPDPPKRSAKPKKKSPRQRATILPPVKDPDSTNQDDETTPSVRRPVRRRTTLRTRAQSHKK